MFGQNVKFSDLVYYTTLTNREVYDILRQGKAFKQDYTMDVNGQEIEYFRGVNADKTDTAVTEKIVTGHFTKLYNGTVLRTLYYTSANAQYIINMISQAKRYGLDLKFRGADASSTIYLYDNNFYHVSIYLRHDQKSGIVEIKQREYLGLD
jgi:hypothetical protein